MEIGTRALAGSTPVLTIELLPEDAVQLLSDMRPELTTTAAYDKLHAALETFARRHA